MNKVTQSIYKNAVDKSLFDNNDNFRFISGNGTPLNVDGVTISSSKWTLNGNNLMFEIIGTVSKSIQTLTKICTFILPDFIISKISTLQQYMIDLMRFECADEAGGFAVLYSMAAKDNNSIAFNITPPFNVTRKTFFRIRYNIIIDY